jgi:hypothetical protein
LSSAAIVISSIKAAAWSNRVWLQAGLPVLKQMKAMISLY